MAAVKIGCPWCMDFGYRVLHGHGMPREKIEAVPQWRNQGFKDRCEVPGLTQTSSAPAR